jgi:lysyl-tRNA synthetase class 2
MNDQTPLEQSAIDPSLQIDENHLINERREKLARLRQQGLAYPNDFVPTHLALELHQQFNALNKEELADQAVYVKIAGRMLLKRVMGKASFATVQDRSGQIQFYINDNETGEESHTAFKHWDMGDIIAAEGLLFKTNRGELSVQVKILRLLTKSLRPLPEKFHGLTSQEMKYRQRYVDLIVSPQSRQTFITRTKAINALREFMQEADFMEVETPMLHVIPGGASAKPFITHHNALDMEMFLRIAPELYLKRLVVGGFERVFEINRNFRNEGVSPRHNPEFTMMEFYAAYTDYQWLMQFTENLIRQVSLKIHNTAVLNYQGRELDLSAPFERLTITEAILKYAPKSGKNYTTEQINDRSFIRTK